jgi:hypothetical protein
MRLVSRNVAFSAMCSAGYCGRRAGRQANPALAGYLASKDHPRPNMNMEHGMNILISYHLQGLEYLWRWLLELIAFYKRESWLWQK